MSLAELENKLKALEDLEKIKNLHHKYVNLMDNLKYQEVLDLFTEDAEVEVRNSGVKHGRKEICEIYLDISSRKMGNRNCGHLAAQPDIFLNGDTARGTWLIYMFYPEGKWVQGINDVEYRKNNGNWKISKLNFTRTLASEPALFP